MGYDESPRAAAYGDVAEELPSASSTASHRRKTAAAKFVAAGLKSSDR